jgi:hypothetical protein
MLWALRRGADARRQSSPDRAATRSAA